MGVGLFIKMEDRGLRYYLGSVYYCYWVIDINGLDISFIVFEDIGVFFFIVLVERFGLMWVMII